MILFTNVIIIAVDTCSSRETFLNFLCKFVRILEGIVTNKNKKQLWKIELIFVMIVLCMQIF